MTFDTDETPEATALIATLDRLWGGKCRDCLAPYRGQEAVFSIALGFKDAPRCLPCLARGLQREPVELRNQLLEYIQRRDCYRQAFAHACEREQTTETGTEPSECIKPDQPIQVPSRDRVAVWDAGDMSCGDLVLALRIRLAAMAPGDILKVIARDPAAPEDLPSWCRLTGHTLLEYHHPEYRIRRKET